MRNASWLSWSQLNSRTLSGLPFVLALLAAGLFIPKQCLAETFVWRICEVYSNADGSSQFVQFCGKSSEELAGVELSLLGRTLTASDGALTHSFVFPVNPTQYYDSHRLLVATQGFADLNLIKPDFVVPNGFLPVPNGAISLANHDSINYAGLPTDGSHAIDADFASRPINGGPSTAITLATASNFDWQSYGFASQRSNDIAEGRWVTTGSLRQARAGHTATLLPSGKVLVVGGHGIPYHDLDTAELFDPATGTWSAAGNLHAAKSGHSATLLPNGKVLVVGQAENATDSAELFDPATGTWSVIGGPSGWWRDHTATLLYTGNVLLAGGWGGPGYSSYYRAVLYDPATGSWSNTGSLNVPRGAAHQATLLQDGSVLVTGGSSDADFFTALHSAESYDPAAGTWSRVGLLHVPRAGEPATLLPNGGVLIAGGNVAELYDPATRKWTVAEPLAIADIHGNTVTLLSDGIVLVAGGYRPDPNYAPSSVDGAELYDPISQTTRKTASLNTARFGHTATRLQNGSVLLVGGQILSATNALALLDSAEIFEREGRGATIGAGFTGSWFNPAQNGHGFALEVIPGSPPQLFASWFTFAPQGGQSWVVGLGPITGNRAVVRGSQTVGAGAKFPPNFDAANVHQEDWGTLTFSFSDCNHGHVDWAPTVAGYASGGMDLTRLTLPAGLTC